MFLFLSLSLILFLPFHFTNLWLCPYSLRWWSNAFWKWPKTYWMLLNDELRMPLLRILYSVQCTYYTLALKRTKDRFAYIFHGCERTKIVLQFTNMPLPSRVCFINRSILRLIVFIGFDWRIHAISFIRSNGFHWHFNYSLINIIHDEVNIFLLQKKNRTVKAKVYTEIIRNGNEQNFWLCIYFDDKIGGANTFHSHFLFLHFIFVLSFSSTINFENRFSFQCH